MYEVRRSRARFAGLVAALSLAVCTVVVLAALAEGALHATTSALRTGGADLLVLSAGSGGDLVLSDVDQAGAPQVAALDGVEAVGPLGALPGGAAGPEGGLDLVLFGYRPGSPGGPAAVVEGRLPEDGPIREAVADGTLRGDGVALGDTVLVAGSDAPLRIVGFVEDRTYQGRPTVWTSVDTWTAVREQVRPEPGAPAGHVHALAVDLAPGADPAAVAAGIGEALPGTRSIPLAEALRAVPGAGRQRWVFGLGIGAVVVGAAVLVALLFALLSRQQRPVLAMLGALGASEASFTRGLGVQVAIVGLGGLLLGGLLAWLVALALPDSVPMVLRPGVVAGSSVLMLAAALAALAVAVVLLTRPVRSSPLGGTL